VADRTAPPKSVHLWLLVLYAFIGLMVVVGGVTRLTGSGLSMVEWRPLMGALPPLSESAWQATFAKYQLSPQYQLVNHWMELADFKRIFFWEWFHRLLGRTVGLVCAVPWLYFVVTRRLRGRWLWLTLAAFFLGGGQGLLGWFMVKSGLVDVPAVSHYRLAAHLSLAFLCGQWVLWIAFDTQRPDLIGGRSTRASRLAWALVPVVMVQIIYGAFMAGSRAGYMFQTFPDMNGGWIAPGSLGMEPAWLNFFANAAMIHTVHRWLAWAVVILVASFVGFAMRRVRFDSQRRALWLLLTAVLVQLALGAATVMTGVNLVIAVAHQLTAYLLLSATLLAAHRLRTAR
jgi:cytochrome c oxidase assembly protein subunit 15